MTGTDVAYTGAISRDTLRILDVDGEWRTFADVEIVWMNNYLRGTVDIGDGETDRVMIRFENIVKIERIA